jgi:hypothetical protein
LIVATFGSAVAEWVPKGRVGVETADGKRYTVPSEQYEPRTVNLMSQYSDVREVPVPDCVFQTIVIRDSGRS